MGNEYNFPSTGLLLERPKTDTVSTEEAQAIADKIIGHLKDLELEAEFSSMIVGPTILRFVFNLKKKVIKSQIDEIAMVLSWDFPSCRIMQGEKKSISIEGPNPKPKLISSRSALESDEFATAKKEMTLPIAVGSKIDSTHIFADLTKMPHLLVAGTTCLGGGMTVFLNSLITSLLYAKRPEDLKFVLIDPNMVKFSQYEGLKETYLAKFDDKAMVITDTYKAIDVLESLCIEMDNRYELLKAAGVYNIKEYNEKFGQYLLPAEDGHRHLPYILTIIDEYADLFVVGGKKIELPIVRIAQKARAVGIHMILATQRPSTKVITCMIKANFPVRVAFKVSQRVDSKTILDQEGAERLIGRGDMLFFNGGELQRIQSPYIESSETERVVEHIEKGTVSSPYILPDLSIPESSAEGVKEAAIYDDTVLELFGECVHLTVRNGKISSSFLQRNLGIGYIKASLFIQEMEKMGIIAQSNECKPLVQKVLMTPKEAEEALRNFMDEQAQSK